MRALCVIALAICVGSAQADPAEIVGADARKAGDTWTVSVTLRHGDTGWDDYADGWRVIGPDGAVLATRVLFHLSLIHISEPTRPH